MTREAALTPIDDTLWQAVISRTPRDGGFYGVSTMRVFCRFGCPARPPLRRNAVFFRTAAEAEAAGYRACGRCDPKGERAAIAREAVRDACAFIESADDIPPLETLARRAGYSPFHFLRMFKAHTGLTPRSFAEGLRARRLQATLETGARVADAVAEAGFGSESRVYERTGTLLGMTPGAARRGGAGETIRTAFADSPLGRLLIGATKRGVCFLGFGDRDGALEKDLQKRFPRAALVRDDPGLSASVAAVLRFLDEPNAALDLPLDLRGTAFQLRVWRALQQIAPGETRSYAQVAAAIGSPSGVRAVAHSCAANPVALAVPCHRVIGSDGKLTGYRWGLPRKRALLQRERRSPAA